MNKLDHLKKHLKPGGVYRRADLEQWTTSVDRHLAALVKDGTLRKMSQGVYYFPKQSAFGVTPPEENELVKRFLKDDRFLVTSPNAYNSLGVGTTQLYNQSTVYNHKRHGAFKLGNRTFDFQVKHHFPEKLSKEFLMVDLVNNLDRLAEDQEAVLKNVSGKVASMDHKKLQDSVNLYAGSRAKKIFQPLLQKQ